jgi:hypothetical protein
MAGFDLREVPPNQGNLQQAIQREFACVVQWAPSASQRRRNADFNVIFREWSANYLGKFPYTPRP